MHRQCHPNECVAENAGILVPALLTHSSLIDVVSGQEIIPLQHWLIQGLPVPGLCADALSRDFLFSLIFRNLTDANVRKAIGNMMHAAPIGAWLGFALATTTKVFGRDAE